MQSLFDQSSRSEIISRINKLTADAKPQWGKMNSAQMLAHCTVGLKTATGELKVKRAFIGRLLGGYAKKKFLIKDEPFGKNSPTGTHLIVKDDRNFDDEKSKLIAIIEKFGNAGASGVNSEPHTFFGELTPELWDKLMAKHIEHHLVQFGV